METEIKRWGNSAAVRLPATLLAKAGLEVNSSVEIQVLDGEILIKPVSLQQDLTLNDAPKGQEQL